MSNYPDGTTATDLCAAEGCVWEGEEIRCQRCGRPILPDARALAGEVQEMIDDLECGDVGDAVTTVASQSLTEALASAVSALRQLAVELECYADS